MPSTSEFRKVFPTTPNKLFAAFKQLDTYLPKVTNSFVARGQKIRGDGGQGTAFTLTFAPDFLGGETLMITMEEWDEDCHTFTADVQGDERFSSCKVTMRFLPGPSSGTTTGTWIAHYTPNYERATSPENMWFVTSPCLMAIAVYVDAHS